jgi:hypothetical protein
MNSNFTGWAVLDKFFNYGIESASIGKKFYVRDSELVSKFKLVSENCEPLDPRKNNKSLGIIWFLNLAEVQDVIGFSEKK